MEVVTDNLKVIIVPGWLNSTKDHWQRIWERKYKWIVSVEMPDWENPTSHEWNPCLEAKINESASKVVILAHSLGCHSTAQLNEAAQSQIAGAFFVAPPDLSSALLPHATRSFASYKYSKLPFPSFVIASCNDRFSSLETSKQLAEVWGAHFLDVGALGHINAEAVGAWPAGEKLFFDFLKRVVP